MKKLMFLILIVLLASLLSSCVIRDVDMNEKINAPSNKIPPIEGKWVIDGYIKTYSSSPDNTKEENNIGKEGLFHRDAIVLGEEFSTNPSFKTKKVKALDYLIYRYKTIPSSLEIDSEWIEVITVFNDEKYFYEFIKYDDDKMYVYVDDTFYKLSKTVNEVSLDEINRYITVEKNIMRTLDTLEADKLQTGILLGLRIPTYDEINQMPNWEYKTIWINSQDRKIVSVYELQDLLVPRKNGFWMVNINREISNDSIKDDIVSTPQFRPEGKSVFIGDEHDIVMSFDDKRSFTRTFPSVLRNIQFVGNDYISVENIELDKGARKVLQVFAMDNIEDKKPIKLSDLVGENGGRLFVEGAQTVFNLDSNIILNEENVGLTRRNGYWSLKGRINYRQNEEELYKDFSIKAIPPKEMVSYDELAIPWNAVKMIIPDALDVFSSPNNEFIIVVNHTHLVLYSIDDGNIINNPIAKIKLPYDATVIMSEWAIGRYANIWESQVIKNNGIEIEY